MLEFQNLTLRVPNNLSTPRKLAHNKGLGSLGELISLLKIDLSEKSSIWQGPCPIHGGDNPHGFCIYKSTGRWFCWTHSCHEDCINDLVSLVSKVNEISYDESTELLSSLSGDPVIPEKSPREYKQIEEIVYSKTRQEIRKDLIIPPDYYLERGIRADILDQFDIGLCVTNTKMRNRIVFPIYNRSHQYVGCTGRTVLPVTKDNPKWYHDKIKTGNHFYNHFAYDAIDKTRTVILVESCGNVLKLCQNGIWNCFGIFGAKLTQTQKIKLDMLDINRYIILLDNDEAGKKGTNQILKMIPGEVPQIDWCGRNDVADLTDEEITQMKEFIC